MVGIDKYYNFGEIKPFPGNFDYLTNPLAKLFSRVVNQRLKTTYIVIGPTDIDSYQLRLTLFNHNYRMGQGVLDVKF